MTGEAKAPVLTAKEPRSIIRLFEAYDACKRLCSLTVPPSLAPLRLMLADAPSPRDSGANRRLWDTLFEGFGRIVASPPLPRRLRAMGRTV